MTNKEIKEHEKTLSEISALPFEEQPNKLQEFGKKIGINAPHAPGNVQQNQVIHMTQAIQSCLQTKMMLNACVSAETSSDLAKQACRWAAIAAITTCIGVVLSLMLILKR